MMGKNKNKEKQQALMLGALFIIIIGGGFFVGRNLGWWGAMTSTDTTNTTGTQESEVGVSTEVEPGVFEPVQTSDPIYIPPGPNDPNIDNPEIPSTTGNDEDPGSTYIPPGSDSDTGDDFEPELIDEIIVEEPVVIETSTTSTTDWILYIIIGVAILIVGSTLMMRLSKRR